MTVQPVGSITVATSAVAGNQPIQPIGNQIIKPAGTQLVNTGTPLQIVQTGNQPAPGTGPQKIIIIQVGLILSEIKVKELCFFAVLCV